MNSSRWHRRGTGAGQVNLRCEGHHRCRRPADRLRQSALARNASAGSGACRLRRAVAGGGARCVGKTVTDELAFSLLGENPHYGTPLNPSAPERVPGGSSSGSASAVASGSVDFALGSDTGGSVRVPASNCGIFGMRRSHGRISIAGVMPFAPTFDTVGLFARGPALLARSASVLLGCDCPDQVDVRMIHLLPETFALCTPQARRALRAPLAALRRAFSTRRDRDFHTLHRPNARRCGSGQLVRDLLRAAMVRNLELPGGLGSGSKAGTGPGSPRKLRAGKEPGPQPRSRGRTPPGALCAGASRVARPRQSFVHSHHACTGTVARHGPAPRSAWRRILSPRPALCALAGIGRLPQVSVPAASCAGALLGLSLVAAHGEDAFLLSAVQQVAGGCSLASTPPVRSR